MTGDNSDAAGDPPFGGMAPAGLDRTVIAATERLPDNWLGLRLAIGLRRIATMRLPGDEALDVTRWGLRMRLHPRYNSCEKSVLFTPQMYDARERAALAGEIAQARRAGRPFVFLDVGANVGLYSLFVASMTGANARILAFEPEPENLRRLRFNIAANPGLPIEVFPVALGEAAGRATLHINARNRGGTHTRHQGDDGASGTSVVVDCRPLVEIVLASGVQSIDAMKIDVEGSEDKVLVPYFRNASEALWPRFIIIEDTRAFWQHDVLAMLEARGYAASGRTRVNVILRRT